MLRVAMASAWRLECVPCRWIGFADMREDADRMAKEHTDGNRVEVHAVTIDQGPKEPTR
jgi:hypothetical protein